MKGEVEVGALVPFAQQCPFSPHILPPPPLTYINEALPATLLKEAHVIPPPSRLDVFDVGRLGLKNFNDVTTCERCREGTTVTIKDWGREEGEREERERERRRSDEEGGRERSGGEGC